MSTVETDIWDDEKEASIDFTKIIRKIKTYWPLSLLSAAIFGVLAFFYLHKTNPVYNVSASVLIQDKEKKGGGSGNMLSSLQDLGILEGASNVNNEQMIITSYPLVEEVVNDLQLFASFHAKEKFRTIPLYKNTVPFKATFLDITENHTVGEAPNYEVILNGTNGYTVLVDGKEWKGTWNAPLKLPFGTLVLQPNEITNAWPKDKHIEMAVHPAAIVAESFHKSIIADIPNKQTSIINLSFANTVPQRGVDFINALVDAYQQSTVDDNNKLNESTLSFVSQRLNIVGKELDSIENKIADFKKSNQLADLPLQSAALIDNMGKQEHEMNNQQVQLSMVNSLIDFVQKNKNNPNVIPASLVVNNELISKAINDYNQLLLQRDRLGLSATAENPVMQNINEQLARLQNNISSGLQSIKLSLSTGVNKMQQQNASMSGMVKKVPALEQEFGDYSRQQIIKRELYLFLLQKREESLIAKSSTLANSRIISAARADTKPISPKRTLVMGAAILLGLLVPFGFAYLFELTNTKTTTRAEIDEKTGLPVIGEIGHSNEDKLVVVSPNSRSLVAEQFRALRANLHFLFSRKDDKVILLTSTVSGEGKTFISTNLATVFSLTDKKVVLLELDLRKPKIMKGLGQKKSKGFTEYVIGNIEAKDIIIPSGINQNLFIIPSGAVPPNPSELLLHQRTKELFDYLRAHFDVIIIDTTPNIVSDAQILSAYADVSLYLVRLGYTTKDQLKQIATLAKTDKFSRLNLIINDIKPKRYGGGYGYGYGYGYGNYVDDVETKKKTKRIGWRKVVSD